MQTGHAKGLWAETFAGLYLTFKGYRILARRFKTPLGEIDLVAKRGGTIVFVEVKLRATVESAAEAIHVKNQSRIRNAAALYVQKYPAYSNMAMRFDALVLARGCWPVHIKDAF